MAHSANPSALTKTHLAHTAQSSARHTKPSAWGKKPSAQGSNPSAVAQAVKPSAQSASTGSASEQPNPANSTRPKRASYKLDVKFPCRFVPQELYQRMSDDLHLTGKAERTRQGYLRAVCKLATYCQTTPDQITEAQLRRYFLHLKNERQFAYGSLRVALSGVKFFYSVTCKRPWEVFKMLELQNINALPEVITIEQVNAIFEAATTLRMKTFFWTIYSLGLRLNEGLNLQVGDIDAARGMVHIHRGKGAKDRYVPLPTSTLMMLREYWVTHRHKHWLFPADGRNHALRKGRISQAINPMSETAVQDAIKLIAGKLNFGKKVSTHTLRHSYGTHLLEAGVSLKAIQQFMGHSSLQTTMVYLHLTQRAEADAKKTIETLFKPLAEKTLTKNNTAHQSKPSPSSPSHSKSGPSKSGLNRSNRRQPSQRQS